MELRLEPAAESDIPLVRDIMNDATLIKEASGDDIWSGKLYTDKEIAGYLEQGLLVARFGDIAVGSVILASSDERMWGERGVDETALYIHKLARINNPPIKGVGARIITLCEDRALSEGKSLIRLDCETSNAGLVEYYRDTLGFRDIGRVTVDSTSRGQYEATLFEKPLEDAAV